MLRYVINLFVSLVFFTCKIGAVTDPLLDELLKRNGDVYLLVSDSSTDTGHLYRFDRSNQYSRGDVIPSGSPLKTQLPQYVGFAVDKFGHVKLFRAKDDIDNPTGSTSILTLTGRTFPGETGSVQTGTNTMNLPGSTSVSATSIGWRYVIAPDGKEGWKKVFTDTTQPGNMNATSGTFLIEEIPGAIPVGSVLLPPYFKSMPMEYNLEYHGSFWQSGRESYRLELAGSNSILTVTSRNEWWEGGNAFTTTSCFTDIPYGNSEELWGIGQNCGVALSPPIGAFFMIPHYSGSWTGNFGTYRAATKVKDSKKSVKTLLVNTFLSQEDNSTLQNFGPASGVFTNLQTGRDYFSGVGGEGYSDASDNVLANTVSFSVDAGRWNHCGDLCGLGPSDSPASPPPPPSSRAYASSFGDNQDEQKMYMIRRASFGGTNVVTSVIEIRVAQGSTAQASLVNPNQTCPNTHAIDNVGIDCYSLGDADANFSTKQKQVVYKAFANDLGVTGNFPDYPQSLGFSKRRDGQDSDYVYWSNLPATHFTVSSNFWGTGGTLWYAVENANDLKLHFKNFNHTTLGVSSSGVIDAGDRLPVKALAADGDNNVYLVHSKDAIEGPDQIERQFGNFVNKNSVQELCANGVMKNCDKFDFSGGMTACLNAGVPTDPLPVELVMKQHAGFVVEKLSPLTGSEPEKLGVVPNVEIGECRANAYFPLSASESASCNFNWDRPATTTDPWVCTVTNSGGVDLSHINVELAVINVPNPPASGTGMNPRIVHPCYANNPQTCDGNKALMEDQDYIFRMENPPHFAGVPAVLGQSADGILKDFGTVQMISNYEKTGYDFTKDLTLSSGEAGKINDLYFDNDGEVGIITATMLNEDFSSPADDLMNPSIDQGVSAERTMRYRWIVRAKSPPHSLVDYTQKNLEYKPLGYPANVKTNCQSIINQAGTRVLSDGITVYQYPDLQDPTVINKLGLMYDSCWQDLERIIAEDPQGKPVYSPDNLTYKFTDPGVYQITLMIGGLGFDLEGITYRSDPASVRASIIVTHKTMTFNVGAAAPSVNQFVSNMGISIQDMSSGDKASWELGNDTFGSSNEINSTFADEVLDGTFRGLAGNLPVYPVYYYRDENLVVTHSGQITPLYAEAEIEFFKTENTEYLDPDDLDSTQGRKSGVGVWDFSYECGADGCGQVGSLNLVDKSDTHPSNYNLSAGQIVITSEYGNDASLDITSKRGSGRYVDASLNVKFSDNPDDIHQGTVARDDYFQNPNIPLAPSNPNMENNPYAFYTWYEIKYAWFARFRTPDGTVREKIIRTGNLAEIFLLNFYANHDGLSKYKTLIKNVLAPSSLEGSGFTDIGNGKLITEVDATERKYKIRIPLMTNNAIFYSPDLLSELEGKFRDGWASRSDWSLKTMQQILTDIRPMKFEIPTGTTVIEVACQIFAPAMTWKGNEPIIDSNGTTSDIFSYYDAVPGVFDMAGSILPATGDHPIIGYSFGPVDNFVSWNSRGILKEPTYNKPDRVAGLQLSNELGGFAVSDDGSVTYSHQEDHFVEINVVDQQNPRVTFDSGSSQSLNAGQATTAPIVITITDNNPYQDWLNSPSGTNDTPDKHPGLPMLSNFYYEVGYDPRNKAGLGLLENKSYSFHVSHKEQKLDDNLAFKQGAINQDFTAQVYPGQQSPNEIGSDANNFFSFGAGSLIRENDLFFLSSSLHTDVANKFDPILELFWNADIEQGRLFPPFPPSVSGSADSSEVYENTKDTVNQPMLYQYFAPHMPDSEPNYFQWPEDTDNSNRRKLVYIGDTFSEDCLKNALPQKEISANCGKTSTYELQDGAAFAPIFFNNDYGPIRKVYAAGQDARIFSEYVDVANPGSTPLLSSFSYRLVGKSSDANFDNSSLNGLGDLSAIRARAQSLSYDHLAQPLATFNYVDTTPPNLRVSLTDYKTRASIHYVVTMVQSVDKNSANDNRINFIPRVNIYRSADNRGDQFVGPAIQKTLEIATPENEYRVSAHTASPDNLEELFYEITEDTRFQLHATFSDNVTGKELGGSLNISSDSCSNTASLVGSDINGEQLAALDGDVMEQYRFPSVGPADRAPNQYQDFAELRAYHLYPKHGYFDEIKVIATDSAGNKTAICIPVRIIPQDVHFRKIGNQSKSR